MLGLVIPALLALVVGVLLGGSLSAWSNVRVRWWPLAAASLMVQAALFSPLLEEQPWAIAWGPWLYVATMAGVLISLLASARCADVGRLALSMAALGVWLNCLVVASNGGYMPRSETVFEQLGRPPGTQADEARARLVNVQPLAESTRLAALGDIIVEPGWLPLANVISVGDVLLSLGLAWWTLQMTSASTGFSLRRWRPPLDAGRVRGAVG